MVMLDYIKYSYLYLISRAEMPAWRLLSSGGFLMKRKLGMSFGAFAISLGAALLASETLAQIRRHLELRPAQCRYRRQRGHDSMPGNGEAGIRAGGSADWEPDHDAERRWPPAGQNGPRVHLDFHGSRVIE
jgi:hypothetical protein